MIKINPLPGKVIVKPLEEKERKTDSGIILSGAAENMRWVFGEVIAAATYRIEGDKRVDMILKVGDKLYFDELSTREFRFKNDKYYCVFETDAYGVVEE